MTVVDRHCVLLSSGYSHPFAETGDVLEMFARDAGWRVARYEDADAAIEALGPDTRLFIVNALWWSMTQNEKYAADRAQWARKLSDASMERMRGFVEDGGALLAMHTSVICWDTQPGWLDLLGGGWRWHHSHHPPYGPCAIELTEAGAALVQSGPRKFDLVDEIYHALDPASDCDILANGSAGGDGQPVAWLRRVGDGVVAVDALGHDARSLQDPVHHVLLTAILARLGNRDVA